METLAVAVRALRGGMLRPGEQVVVVGAGAVGPMSVQAARAFGAGGVAVVEPFAARRSLACRLGADRAVPADDAAALQADVAVESAGRPPAVATAIRALRSGGRAVLLGLGTRPVSVLPMDLVGAEKSIIGSATQRSARGRYGRQAAAAFWQPSRMVSHCLTRTWEYAEQVAIVEHL